MRLYVSSFPKGWGTILWGPGGFPRTSGGGGLSQMGGLKICTFFGVGRAKGKVC